MTRQLMQQTQVTVSFQISTDKEQELVVILQLLATLAMLIWRAWKVASWPVREAVMTMYDLWQAVSFVAKVYAIGFNSIRFGIGL